MNESLVSDFKKPGNEFRGKPFWAWNGRLEPEELRRQIRVMRDMGLGGFFMHSRVGLATAYLSDDWFRCVDACIDEAKELGMEAWLYDEDRWPSGAAGGLVTKNPKHRMRSLAVRILKTPGDSVWDDDTIAVFTAKIEDAVARNVRPVPRGALPAPGPDEAIVRFGVELQGSSDWYNGYTYLDTLSHEAVRAFIKSTHELYKKKTGKFFGKTIPGIFTDEPNHGNILAHDNNTNHAGGLPWTGSLLKTFRKRYGYDLEPHLMELAYDVKGNGMTPARYHYHDCITYLYVDAFCRQIGEWCAKNKLLFTGHQLSEDTLASQTNMVGSCLRTYEYMQAPGMDLLTEHWRAFNTAKQVSSGARQFGAKWRLTETYGCTGWDFPFSGHKALGDWQLALGINLRCQHLSWYTMEGEAKRDYPAGIFYQSPWWQLYPKVEDYFARVHAAMTRGKEVRDLLVIHPVESMWMQVKTGWQNRPETQVLDLEFERLTSQLLAQHLDFDFGDEELLARHARITKASGGASLQVGKAEYKSVLVPPLKTMRRSTLEMLKKFRAAGGTVVFAGEPAAYLEAVPTRDVTEFAAACPRSGLKGTELAAALASGSRRVSIAGPDGTEIGPALYLLREDREAQYIFVCNTGEDFAADNAAGWNQQPLTVTRTLAFGDVRIRGFAGCAGAPVELNPETGTMAAADAVLLNGHWEIRTSLPALGSRIFVVPKKGEAGIPACSSLPRPRELRNEILDGESWDITLSECANLVLDRPRCRINGGDWQAADEILRIDKKVHNALGIPHRGGSMKQPWARPVPAHPKRALVELAYAFRCDAIPSGELFLALEQPRTFRRITLNGAAVSTDADCGWWTDRSLRRLPLDPTTLRKGDNELVLECDYPETHSGLEIVYLLGNFGTAVDGTNVAMTAMPLRLRLGDWVPQGLAFYSGSVAYRRTINPDVKPGERLFVEVPDYCGIAVRVLVDGKEAGIAAWAPQEVEITGLVGNAPVELQVEVVGHRRNSHGPFHLKEKWPMWTGPGEFQVNPDRWLDGYQLVPCGLNRPPRLRVQTA